MGGCSTETLEDATDFEIFEGGIGSGIEATTKQINNVTNHNIKAFLTIRFYDCE